MPTTTFKLRLLKTTIFVLLLAAPFSSRCQLIPLPNAFAHNDYSHKRPLFDALDNGYNNVEADIFLNNGSLIVAHINPYFKQGHTLEALYLKPLLDKINQNHGRIYSGYEHPLTLMIDIKTDAEQTYAALKVLLEKYSSILTRYQDGKVYYKQITVVLSGNKPFKSITTENNRLAFIDEDLRAAARDTINSGVFMMASCKYNKLLSWDGYGQMPDVEKNLLSAYVEKCHRLGKRVRLWASPENMGVWQELLNCGVDLINTDRLVQLKDFLLANKPVYAKAD
ncbi:phosphatidylinositol-specific phospholipase C/glycerophosphodiester phosphodiesterase family protein [Mucilaginibacter sp. dw_454]|uniref:phosphatidylinositol-specific phospholipase C/glycerophosphodiester phosphodiesterase family protein n=1 Tax=Mucilaginibacter sp. dw_454 TaxID=2720079 RepID=UPI001BD28F9D|nr:phosphatidylinositol-specific phospholipase C/glycerophosphodiester phosphodiesterase family protein [Mucilaginibacter sp. dw_454]